MGGVEAEKARFGEVGPQKLGEHYYPSNMEGTWAVLMSETWGGPSKARVERTGYTRYWERAGTDGGSAWVARRLL